MLETHFEDFYPPGFLSLSLSLPCHLTKQFRQMEHRQSMLASFPFFSFCDTNLCRVEDRGFYPSASASVSVARVEVLGNLWSWGNKDRPDWLGRISGYLAKRAMKNFAAGRNDNRFIYSVSPKTREREDWTADTDGHGSFAQLALEEPLLDFHIF